MADKTTIATAFETAGLKPEENAFLLALARFLNNGGTRERAHRLIDLPSRGQNPHVRKDHAIGASGPATPVAAEGQPNCADKAKDVQPPPRPPSAAAKAAAGKAAKMAAQSVLDSFKITMRQGSKVAIGDIPIASYPLLLRGAEKRAWVSSREHLLIKLLKDEADKQAHIPEGALTRDIFKVADVAAKIDAATTLALPRHGQA
jgi:hypothetical protein